MSKWLKSFSDELSEDLELIPSSTLLRADSSGQSTDSASKSISHISGIIILEKIDSLGSFWILALIVMLCETSLQAVHPKNPLRTTYASVSMIRR